MVDELQRREDVRAKAKTDEAQAQGNSEDELEGCTKVKAPGKWKEMHMQIAEQRFLT